ncbi:sulfotransferase family protein [Nodosilinea nodulosa]|uniref:sulfotransferase family protein n=1 Tax=Nodosilinea nodulosa TaxID=416001 RepID=UPI0002D7C44D|nr:sulfotransferase [Nodosilinea nodulosa]
MTLPNFLIVGAAKAGTTSLYKYLSQHPQVYMSPRKEPRYFAPEYYTTFYHQAIGNLYREKGMSRQEYETLFDGVTNEIAIGEASTEYLFFEKSAERIKQAIPDAKILMILRNPIDRAFSAYCFHLRDGRETLSFEEALAQEPTREKQHWQVGWFYKKGGFYYEQVNRYYKLFEHHRIKIILWRNLNQNPRKVCAEVFEFLGVDPSFAPNFSRENASKKPRSKVLNRYVFKNRQFKEKIQAMLPEPVYSAIANPLKRVFYTKKDSIIPEVKEQLKRCYRDDIRKLEDLIKQDLSHWTEN